MLTLLDVVQRTTDYFNQRGVESARLNAELIVAHALGLNRMQIYLQFERPVDEAKLATVRELVRRRGQREPLAYVLGAAAFGDLMLKVDRRVLVPRPETEQLVELIKDTVGTPPKTVLDLGSGSGALALTLATIYPDAQITAVDNSAAALEVARENAAKTGLADRVSWRHAHWFDGFTGSERFELIVANPPYLTEAEWTGAEPEVRLHEPKEALVAGDEGRADLEAILRTAPEFLASDGWLFLETGVDQHPRLLAAANRAGLCGATSAQDWSGRDRFIFARAPA